jgi:hypothetical protein
LTDVVVARSNLGITSTATQPEAYFLRAGQHFADVSNTSLARSNLGLTSTATTALSTIVLKADNLAGLANTATARANLGLGSAAVLDSSTWLMRANNLSDLTNAQTARNNLGLQNGATINFGGVGQFTTFNLTQNPSTSGSMYIGALKLQWGPFSIGGGNGNSVGVGFSLPVNNPLFYSAGVDNAATEQIGCTNISQWGMTIQKGIGDAVARTGRWIILST